MPQQSSEGVVAAKGRLERNRSAALRVDATTRAAEGPVCREGGAIPGTDSEADANLHLAEG